MNASTPVFIKNIWDKEPVYHRRSTWGWQRRWSACGRVQLSDATGIPLRTAQKIGRACKQCWSDPAERPRPVVPTSHAIWRAVQA